MSDQLAPPAVRRGRKRAQEPAKLSATMVNRELRAMMMTSLNFIGGVEYLVWLSKKHPGVYAQLLGKLIKASDDDAGQGDIQFVVQQITVQATPTPGVIASPVAAHVAPVRLIANGGEVIDAEDSGNG